LTLADENLGEGWAFSKCYKCAGFSLIKSSEKGALKLTGSPPPAPTQSAPDWKFSQRALNAGAAGKSKVNSVTSVNSARPNAEPLEISPSLATELPTALPPVEPTRARPARLPQVLASAAVFAGVYALAVWLNTPVPVAPPSVPTAPALPVVAKIEAPVVSDSISHQVMAPDREGATRTPPALSTGLEIEALSPRVQLRSGPGTQFSVVATVNPKQTYPVADWSERWFRVVIERNLDGSAKAFAWVRNDLVKLVKKNH